MPRGGWKSAPVLDGWVQIVRGPRPKSDKWPKVGQQAVLGKSKRSQSAVGDSTKQKSAWEVPLLQAPSRPPDRVSAEATEEVHRLEAA